MADTPFSRAAERLVVEFEDIFGDITATERKWLIDGIDRLAAKPADEGVREEAAYAAYLGICVLKTMCRKAGLNLAEVRAAELLIEMENAFPEFAGRSALRASTTGEPKR